ncbi:hypothetical protein GCM10010520_36400 [Rhizobium viscosum]|uniref:Uncharacterized protein n=1 Tax=Rhizobium viscosum TaxID=1673 RepID=A0ABR9IT61_RHIVS|nr:hypothetical protein [Rhizobium viscosum]MBE1506047.1 hypothetical protein [Rhizobium viscosum]
MPAPEGCGGTIFLIETLDEEITPPGQYFEKDQNVSVTARNIEFKIERTITDALYDADIQYFGTKLYLIQFHEAPGSTLARGKDTATSGGFILTQYAYGSSLF